MEPIIGQAGAPADAIKDSSTQGFAEDVIAASQEVPVIVDFWAPWCGPCKQLTPTLEKVVRQSGGKVKLVKINIDENPEIAQQLRIQSIPAVFAFKDGQPVDGFAGALPESQVKSFIQRLTGESGPSEIEKAQEMAMQALEAGQYDQAAQVFAQIVRADPQNAQALGGLAQCYVKSGELEQARQTLEMVEPSQRGLAPVAAAQAALNLAEQADDAGDVGDLRAQVEANPTDLQARFDLANALIAEGANEEAVEHLLDLIKRDRGWEDEAARKQLLTLFEAMGPADPVTLAARRQLSSLLFS